MNQVPICQLCDCKSVPYSSVNDESLTPPSSNEDVSDHGLLCKSESLGYLLPFIMLSLQYLVTLYKGVRWVNLLKLSFEIEHPFILINMDEWTSS
ncbi:UNVERIFIED_CONTAM: hypothetical protein NCL1_29560 [Trichonephila clavipes]